MSCNIELTEDEHKSAQVAMIRGVPMMLCGLEVRIISCSVGMGPSAGRYWADISRIMT